MAQQIKITQTSNADMNIGVHKNLTAVEWLLDWMGKNQYFIGNDLLQAVEQAKQMEKEQIMNAYDKVSMSTPEQYYNETYGK